MRYSATTWENRRTADDPLVIAAAVTGILLALVVVAMLLWHPGSCGLAAHTLAEGATVHGPPAVIRLI